MSGDGRGDYSVLQKIQVTCNTCGVSDSFYSNLSVEQFKSKHRGHDVVDVTEKALTTPQTAYGKPAPKEEEPRMEEAVYAVKPPPKEEEPFMGDAVTRLSKVRVDLVVFPVLPEPVFRVRGFKDGEEEAFITTVRSEHAVKVREIIAGGEYVDHDLSGVRYSWEPDAVEYGPDARERLGLPPVPANARRTARPRQELRERIRETDSSTVANTNEILFGESHKEDPGLPRAEVASAPEAAPSVPPAPRVRFETPAPPPSVPEQAKERVLEPSVEGPASSRQPAVKTKEKKAVKTKPEQAPKQAAEEKPDGYLLVSKSWYIQGGKGNQTEALRISQVLKEFRWKVEPVYTIGVMLDDMLSIETSRNQISRTLITRIENAGYRLTAVTTEQGKPVAWFKKTAAEKPSPPGSTSVREKPADEEGTEGEERVSSPLGAPDENGSKDFASSSPGDVDAGLEPDVTG